MQQNLCKKMHYSFVLIGPAPFYITWHPSWVLDKFGEQNVHLLYIIKIIFYSYIKLHLIKHVHYTNIIHSRLFYKITHMIIQTVGLLQIQIIQQ